MTDDHAFTATDDIVEMDDGPSALLGRQADAILEEPRPVPVRQAVREDVGRLRQSVRGGAETLRSGVIERPGQSVLYALGAGVLLGLVLAR